MDAELHELSAGYALDALEPDERDAFERHLADCPECQEEIASFWEVAGALAVAADGPAPSPELRDRILADARAEKQTVVSLDSRRRISPVLAAVTAVAAAVAIGLGIYAVSLNNDLDATRSALTAQENAAALLADSSATSVALQSGTGRLVVGTAARRCSCSTTCRRPRTARRIRPGSSTTRRRSRPERSPPTGDQARRADPAGRAGRRGRRGHDRGVGRRELADAAAARSLRAGLTDPDDPAPR